MRIVRIIGITPHPIWAHLTLGATSYKKPVSQWGQLANYITGTQMTTLGWIFRRYQCMWSTGLVIFWAALGSLCQSAGSLCLWLKRLARGRLTTIFMIVR